MNELVYFTYSINSILKLSGLYSEELNVSMQTSESVGQDIKRNLTCKLPGRNMCNVWLRSCVNKEGRVQRIHGEQIRLLMTLQRVYWLSCLFACLCIVYSFTVRADTTLKKKQSTLPVNPPPLPLVSCTRHHSSTYPIRVFLLMSDTDNPSLCTMYQRAATVLFFWHCPEFMCKNSLCLCTLVDLDAQGM